MTREEAIRWLTQDYCCNRAVCELHSQNLCQTENCEIWMAKKALEEPERKTGHWIIDGEGMLHCSACAEIPVNRIMDTFKVVYDIHPLKMNYCPNCGVRMVGESE